MAFADRRGVCGAAQEQLRGLRQRRRTRGRRQHRGHLSVEIREGYGLGASRRRRHRLGRRLAEEQHGPSRASARRVSAPSRKPRALRQAPPSRASRVTQRIDFYVLASTAPEQRCRLACRLTALAYLENARVIIWAGSDAEARACDELLWTFDDRTFVPH